MKLIESGAGAGDKAGGDVVGNTGVGTTTDKGCGNILSFCREVLSKTVVWRRQLPRGGCYKPLKHSCQMVGNICRLVIRPRGLSYRGPHWSVAVTSPPCELGEVTIGSVDWDNIPHCLQIIHNTFNTKLTYYFSVQTRSYSESVV